MDVCPLEFPSLRKRLDGIPLLAAHFLVRFARQLGQSRLKVMMMANTQDLQRCSWLGNVHELQHVLKRACIVSERRRLKFDHLREASPARSHVNARQVEDRILTVAELRGLEVRNIQAALIRTSGKIYGDAA